MGLDPISPEHVLALWREAGPERWFNKDDAFDNELRGRFLHTWEAARDGLLASWQDSDAGVLALIIVFDQFPRNMFRGNAMAFSTDEQARHIAAKAIAAGVHERIDSLMRAFVYMPFMHSENIVDQERSLKLFEALGDPNNVKFARVHADIIRIYGRFPHRNDALGRSTTEAEHAFLTGGGFSG